MKFKELRDLIYSNCVVVKGDQKYFNIQTHEQTNFDEDEVIGIRSRVIHTNTYTEIHVK